MEKQYKDWFTPEAREHYREELQKKEDAERKIEKLERQLYLARNERDEWRERCKKLVIENIGLQK